MVLPAVFWALAPTICRWSSWVDVWIMYMYNQLRRHLWDQNFIKTWISIQPSFLKPKLLSPKPKPLLSQQGLPPNRYIRIGNTDDNDLTARKNYKEATTKICLPFGGREGGRDSHSVVCLIFMLPVLVPFIFMSIVYRIKIKPYLNLSYTTTYRTKINRLGHTHGGPQ